MTPSVHFIIDDPCLLDRYRRQLGHAEAGQALNALAAALATSRAIPRGSTLLLRAGDVPVLALACPPRDDRRIARHVEAVQTGCRTLRYVDGATARALTARLARRLRDELGPDVSELRYIPIPHGGRVVLEMLARQLRLDQLADTSARTTPDGPVVLVDDIALTGARFAQALASTSQRRVIFAHLYSHPQLRCAIAEHHPDVRCVAAADLTDRAPAVLGDKVAAWRRTALAALTPPRYWVGMTEHVCFPWNEPDRGLLDRDTGTVEPAWSLVSPDRSDRRTAVPVEVLPDGRGSLRPAAGVIFLDVDGGVLVARNRTVRLMLGGVAAPMWRALVATGDRTAILHDLVERYDVDDSTAARDLDAVLTGLLRRGLIAEHDSP